MSRRNKQQNNQVMTLDAFSNPMFRLGFGTQAPLEATEYPLTRMTDNYAKLNSMYRTGGILQSIVDLIPADMLREWFTLSDVDPDRQAEFDRVVLKTQIKDRIDEGLRWGRLYGGAVALILIKGQENSLDKPLDIEAIMPDSFAGLWILDRWSGVFPGAELVDDMMDPDFGLPKFYEIRAGENQKLIARVHHSRILRFTGRNLPYLEKIAEMYWGESEIEPVYEDIVLYDSVMANMGNLTFQANVDTLAIKNLEQLFAVGSIEQQKRFWSMMQAQSVCKSNFGTRLIDQETQLSTQQYSFAGFNYVVEAVQMNLSAKTHIPVTKLFGRSPAGMNATGDSDMQNYYDFIDGLRESRLRPVLERLVPIICMSTWGEVPEEMGIVFPPLWTPTAMEVAQIAGAKSQAIIAAFQSGLLNQGPAMAELKKLSDETGMFDTIDDKLIDKNKDVTFADTQQMDDPLAGLLGGSSDTEEEGSNEENPFLTGDEVIWKTNRRTGNPFPIDSETGKPVKEFYDPTLTNGDIRVNIPLLDRTASKNDVVTYMDDNSFELERYVLEPGSKITNITVFAGEGLKKSVNIGIELEGKTGIPAKEWLKVSGHASVRYKNEIVQAHVHWFEARGKAYSRKVKGWRSGHRE